MVVHHAAVGDQHTPDLERLRSWLKKDALGTYITWTWPASRCSTFFTRQQASQRIPPYSTKTAYKGGGELVANIIHDEVLVDQQSMRLQMEVHTPQQHENAKVKWLNSKNFLGNSTEN
ncbi:hypothetical protein E4U38_002412 [Claviceps purpurea]|nr:hypothetical protein E4U38_002412 [Claviceps purpurea]